MATIRRSRCFKLLFTMAFTGILLTALIPGVAFAAPIVAITKPTQGTVVRGVIAIDVHYLSGSNKPVTRLEIYIDDRLAREQNITPPRLEGSQSFNWDFSASSNTVHKISARAIDSTNASALATVNVQVQNAATEGPDRIAPVVKILYPASGQKVQGRVEIQAEATDNVGVESISFYVDGRLHNFLMKAGPYTDSWDTTRLPDGPHSLEAVASDAAENSMRSAQVTVIVENHSMTYMQQTPAAEEKLLTTSASTAGTPPPLPQPETTVPAPKVVSIVPKVDTPVAPMPNNQPTRPLAVPATSTTPAVASSLPRPEVGAALPAAASTDRQTPKAAAPTLNARTTPAGETGRVISGLERTRPAASHGATLARLQDSDIPTPGTTASLPQITCGAPTLAAAEQLGPTALLMSTTPFADGPLAAPRTSTPATTPVALLQVPSSQRVVPVERSARRVTPIEVEQVAAVKPANSGLSRIVTTETPAAEHLAAISRPATLTSVTQAALAEYRGTPVPASRMLARLPEPDAAHQSTTGRITAPANASAAVPLAIVKVRDIKIVFDGEMLSLRTSPETRQGISLAPLREIFEQTDGVLYWLPVTREVRAVNKNVDMKLAIGDRKVDVNGTTRTLEVAPYIKQGRTMVPLQFIADVLDVNITFNNETGQILISSNQF